MLKNKFLKYFLFGSIYFSIGLEFSVVLIILPIYLIDKGFPFSIATLVGGIGTIPWVIKFFWGGTIDYFKQYGRKFFVCLGGILGGIGFLILVFIDPSISLIPFTITLFFAHVGTAFYDVSTDAWVIDISSYYDRGKINGVMMYGNYLGLTIGPIIFGIIATIYSYSYVFLITGFILIFVVLIPIFAKEVKVVKRHQQVVKIIISEFRKKATQLITLFAPLSAINAGIIMVVVPIYMKSRLNLDIATIGMISFIFPVSIAVGSIFGGIISDKVSRKFVLFSFISPSIFFTALLIFADSWQIVAILYAIIGFLLGGYTTGIFTMFMDITNPKVGATQFSIFASLSNLGELGAGAISGSLITILGFTRVFLFSAWSLGPVLLILYFIRLKSIKKV